MIKEILNDLSGKVSQEKIAAAFHNSLAQTVFELCEKLKVENDISVVVGSGGVFWNKLLTKTLKNLFGERKFVVSEKVPPSDAGLSLGQAVIAERMLEEIDDNLVIPLVTSGLITFLLFLLIV